jgi:hypothetical protein
LKGFKDSSVAPLICVSKVAVKVFDEYLKFTENKEYQKAYRILRVLKNDISWRIINSLKGLKRKFNDIVSHLTNQQAYQDKALNEVN